MAKRPNPPPPDEGLRLHRLLCEKHPAVPSDLARAYLDHLVAWLARKFPRQPPETHQTAAEDALLGLIKNPHAFDPAKLDLAAYLRMAARRDLLNLLRDEARHHRKRVPWKAVEDSPDAGNYLGREDDPCLKLALAEKWAALEASVRADAGGWTEQERRVLALMRQGERRTSAYAKALDITNKPIGEQRREVKRVKDRISKRLGREGRKP